MLDVFHNMQRNQHFQIMISSSLILLAPLVLWAQVATSNSTQENIELEKQRKDAWVMKKIDMLCRGKILLPSNIQKQLKCRYTDNGKTFLKLAPFKEEEAYLEPRIVIFHDVIYDKEIEILKKLTQPQIKLVDLGTIQERLQDGRIGQIAWIYKDEHEILEVLYRRFEHMTRLSVSTAEPVQVFYYRRGGMYLPHFDFAPPDHLYAFENGNRIATLMFYLNDVEEGGRTVFNKLNVSLIPRKGSAAFWYNLSPNGIGDPLTMHAGCPVIAGSKWVTNIWFHEFGQEFLRPCTSENQPAVDWKKNLKIFD